MSLVDVFVGNFPQIDWTLYSLWVEGLSVTEAMQKLRERGLVTSQSDYCKDSAEENNLLASDLADNYRLFGLWESMLHQPVTFSEQLVFQLDPTTQRMLVEQYYALDSSVARELLGRKLTSRLRKDLDEVADKTGVSLRSCRRQFDNIKRVFFLFSTFSYLYSWFRCIVGLKNSKEFSCQISSPNSSYQIIWQRGTLSHLAIQKYSQTKSFSDPGTVCWSSLPVTGWPVIMQSPFNLSLQI